MAKQHRKFDPGRLMAVSRLELVARQAVEGVLAGKHPSPFYGSSAEYADHRPYALGDEIRALDWKLMAKTDKYYVKLFEDRTNLRCCVLLDTSNSMSFMGSSGASEMSKFDYAAHLAAALGYLMLRQNDAVGLALFDHALRYFLPPRSTASHFRRMIERLESVSPGEHSRMAPVMHELAGRLKRRGMVLILSDMLDDSDEMLHAIGHFRHRGHEVIVFHVMDPDELSFPYDRLTRFRDIEGHGMVVASPAGVRREYMKRLHGFLARIKRGCLERRAGYVLAVTGTPWDTMLNAYLAKRGRGGGA